MKVKKKWILMIVLLFLISCTPKSAQIPEQKLVQEQPQQEQLKQEQPKKEIKPYELTPTSLGFEECIKCHSTLFKELKEKGGKHQRDCTFCHKQFHVYSPKRQNWEEIMPKCQTCHGLKHGEKFSECLQCHADPHAIKEKMKVTAEFAKQCSQCHEKFGEEMAKYKSKHTQLGCAACHKEKHGYIPDCFACHKPHTANQTYKDCLVCHKPHSPLNIPPFAASTPNEVCGACHQKPLEKINTAGGKHKDVGCVKCHSAHKYIPDCKNCHKEVHSAQLHKKHPKCSECHVDVHAIKG